MNKREPYWHEYHAPYLFSWMTDQEHLKRLSIIKETKPVNEVPIRLELAKKVKGVLPEELYEAGDAYKEARNVYDKAWDDYDKAWEAYNRARDVYNRAEEVFNKAKEAYAKIYSIHKDAIEALHKKECGCEYWNGKEIVFPKSEEL